MGECLCDMYGIDGKTDATQGEIVEGTGQSRPFFTGQGHRLISICCTEQISNPTCYSSLGMAWRQSNLPDDASLLLPDSSDQSCWHRLQGHWRGDRDVVPHV